MSLSRWLSAVGSLLTIIGGVIGGISMAMLSPRSAQATGLDFTCVSIISYRGEDAVPPSADLTGWEAPMFYTTPVQGAYPRPPQGQLPTGYWAPGDTRQRTLVVRNVGSTYALRLSGIKARLTGELGLAAWFDVEVRDSAGRTVFTGSLVEMAARLHTVTQNIILDPGERETFTFIVHLDIHTDQRVQGTTVLTDLQVHSEVEGYAVGKVSAGTLQYGTGTSRKTGGFVIMRRDGDAAPTGQVQFQDHGMGLNFHADLYTDLLIALDRKRSWFGGSGRLNGVNGFRFRARAYDLGEPGRSDEFEITIYNAAGQVIYSSGSLLGGGNVQIHK